MKRAAAALLLAAATTTAVHAGRPLTTEDVAVVENKACQLESWIDRSHGTTQAWAVPACNFGAGIEWQAGFARTDAQSRQRFSSAYVQGKKVLREPQDGVLGHGIVIGLNRTPLRASWRGWDDPYVTGVITARVGPATLVHANYGWSRDRHRRADSATWGLAGEHAVTERWSAVAEVFGDDRASPFYRAGARMTAMKGLDFDLTLVTRHGGLRADRYLSAGFTWQGAPFLP